MQHLQTIQKAFRVFQILTKIAFIFSIVGASICAVGALCAVAWHNGGQVFGLFGEPIKFFADDVDMKQKYVELWSETIMLAADAILLGFANAYIKTEQSEGTPFTEKGAEKLKKLGIRCIYIPIIAISVATALTVGLGYEDIISGSSNLPSVVMGIVLIITSIIFRYGAELEQKCHAGVAEAGENKE